MGLLEDIEYSKFIVTDAQIEQLSWQHTLSIDFVKRSKTTFMSILIAMSQQLEGTLESLESVYEKLYPSVKAGIEKAGYRDNDITSKATFARTAMSTLRGFIKRGGDLNELDPATVTKRELQAPRVSGPKLQRTEQRLILAIRALAKTDEGAALEEIETLLSSLRTLRKELRGPVRVTGHSLEHVQQVSH